MTRFLRRILWFLLPVLPFAVAAEFYLRSLPNSYRTKAESMELLADSLEVLVLGNSHTYYGVRPDVMPFAAVNLANVSQVLPIDLALLQHYAPLCPRLRHVYLVCDHSNLFDAPLDSTDERFRMTYYHLYMNVCHSNTLRPDWEILHLESATEKCKQHLMRHRRDCDAWGWGLNYTLPLKDPRNCNDEAAAIRAANHTCHDWNVANSNAQVTHEIAAYCQQRGLHLTIIATPVCASYLAAIPSEQQQFLAQLLQSIRRRYDATVLDFSADTSFSADDFFDADHLSDIGAAKFTHKLIGR